MKSVRKSPQGLGGIAMFAGAFAMTLAAIAVVQKLPEMHPGSAAPNIHTEAMHWIPAGEFTMGTDDPDSQSNERPARRTKANGFWIDEHDVTNAEFRKFVQATGYVTTAERPVDWEELKLQVPPGTPRPPAEMLQPGSLVYAPTGHEVSLDDVRQWWRWTPGASWKHPEGPDSDLALKEEYPVIQVSWDDAMAYAKWAGKRLPTEAEWEFAARGGLEGKRFVWGDEFRPGGRFMANTFTGTFPVTDTKEDGFAGVSPWNAFPPNGYGLYDMAGNVWQWTADVYHESSADATCPLCVAMSDRPARGPSQDDEVRRVIKGDPFYAASSIVRAIGPAPAVGRHVTPARNTSDFDV